MGAGLKIEDGPAPMPVDDRRPFLDHLEELRRRLLRCFLWAAVGTALAWRLTPDILRELVRPVGQLVYLSPVEPFTVRLQVAFWGGLAFSFPLLAWEGWGFLRPALRSIERWSALILLPLSVALFLIGAWFGWKLLLPAALKILFAFGAGVMTPMLTVGNYVSFASWLIVGCGLVFQVPLVILFLTRIGLVKAQTLLRQWRLAIIGILIVAAILTPTPDIFTQLLLAAPLGILYLLSAGLALLSGRSKANGTLSSD